MAQRNGDKLMKMVTQLLDIQKYDSKNIKINVQQVALKPFLHHEIERFETLAKQKKKTSLLVLVLKPKCGLIKAS